MTRASIAVAARFRLPAPSLAPGLLLSPCALFLPLRIGFQVWGLELVHRYLAHKKQPPPGTTI